MADRTLKVVTPVMTGADVEMWQQTLNGIFKRWGVNRRIAADGIYGVGTRDATATVLFGLGISRTEMAEGVTAELRIKVRNRKLTPAERARMAARLPWRRRLRKIHMHAGKVAPPLNRIISSSWGYHPPVHDGVDLICDANAIGYAICDGEIIRADSGGWWGKGAPSAAIAAKGDGIVVLRCTTSAGPFRPGTNFGYGHAEHPMVKVGQRVRAGEPICRAGFANAHHFHLVVNRRSDAKGVGDHDPMIYVRYAMKQSGV